VDGGVALGLAVVGLGLFGGVGAQQIMEGGSTPSSPASTRRTS